MNDITKVIVFVIIGIGLLVGLWHVAQYCKDDSVFDRHIEAQEKYILKLESCIYSIGETQQQLIDAGYEWVIIDSNWAQITVDYIWGPKTDAAYCQWQADRSMSRMAGEKK